MNVKKGSTEPKAMIGEGKYFDVTQSFTFDGAHHLTTDHRPHYGDLHGHSWTSFVTVRGELSKEKGWVIDFEQLEQALHRVQALLDHKYHNEIPGLDTPSMENMCVCGSLRQCGHFLSVIACIVRISGFPKLLFNVLHWVKPHRTNRQT
jgi:6-pyruvoyltetrahydropterin/6-carboxytetrahydropterin synthase